MVMAASDGGGTQKLEPIASADTVLVTSSKRPADNGQRWYRLVRFLVLSLHETGGFVPICGRALSPSWHSQPAVGLL